MDARPVRWHSRSRRVGPVALALALLATTVCRPAWAMEPDFEIAGSYDAVVDAMTARLTLDEGGSAQYVVRWLVEKDSSILGKVIVNGRWARTGNTLTLSFPNQGSTGKVVYEISSCLAYKSPGDNRCSPGLHVVSSDLPGNRTWDLWKTEFLRL